MSLRYLGEPKDSSLVGQHGALRWVGGWMKEFRDDDGGGGGFVDLACWAWCCDKER